MQTPPPFWMLAAALLTGLGLLCAPQDQTVRLQTVTRDVLAPGQAAVRAVSDWCQNLKTQVVARWQGSRGVAPSDTDSEALESRLREALAQNALLREQLKHQRTTGQRGGRLQSTEALFVPDLLDARVLGEESLPRLRSQAKKLLGAGEQNGVEISSLAIVSKTPQVDIGEDARLETDHVALDGQAVAGRISQVGRFTSTLLPITDAHYRSLARLARSAGSGLEFGAEGMLEGDGTDTCRLNFIQSTEAVSPGDSVYTASADGGLTTPFLYGTIVQAELPAGAPHWSIRVKPACNVSKLRTVQIIRTKLNPLRMNAQ